MSHLGSDIRPTGDMYPSGYVAKLVHELRTPLTALRGSLGLLASVVDDASPEVKTFAAIAERNASKLAGMLDDLAEIERIRGGSVVPKPERVDVADAIDAAAVGEQSQADQAGVSIAADAAACEVTTDPALLQSLLARLLQYAIRMSPAGSTVRLVATRDGDIVRIDVSDNGKAVNGDGAAMFDPFSLLARRGQDASARPGLGLAIAQATAQLLGASLTFTSAPDGGRFTVTFQD